MAAAAAGTTGTQVGDLPEVCLALAISLTSPLDACRCAAVSPAFRDAADSDDVWRSFLPRELTERRKKHRPPANREEACSSTKDSYLALCDAANAAALDGGGGCKVWLERATGARCYALSAKSLSLPWDDGEFSWRFTSHPSSRFAEVAELVDCTSLDIYGALPAAALTSATPYASFLVYGTAERHRGLCYPDQEATVSVGDQVMARHAVCLRPDAAEARQFRGGAHGADDGEPVLRGPCLRGDGWWEVELGRLVRMAGVEDETVQVQASFEVLGWYPKRGLIVEGIEFRPVHDSA